MNRLGLVLYSLIANMLGAMAIVISLVMGVDTLWPILGAALLGVVAAVPITWVVTRKILAA